MCGSGPSSDDAWGGGRASAPGSAVYKEFGITAEAVVEAANRLVAK